MTDGSFLCNCMEGYLTLEMHQEFYSARVDEFKKDYKEKVCFEMNEWCVYIVGLRISALLRMQISQSHYIGCLGKHTIESRIESLVFQAV
jgi:hypothetical protein